MAEEKKEEKAEAQSASRPDEEAKPKAAEAGKEKAVKKEKPSNCASCNKSIKKKRWYYRNGKYYCTKRCWKTAAKKEAKPEAIAPQGQSTP